MAQTTTNYGLLKPESTDSYNHLIYDNPNMDTIDAAMKANADAAISTATCIKSGTTHTITRSNTSASVFKFTATGDWITGDTMIVDGVTVTPYLVTGEALKTGAYLINGEVLIALAGTRATVFSNQSEAGTTYFDDTNVPYTANNVQDAIEAIPIILKKKVTRTTDANGIATLPDVDINNLVQVIVDTPIRTITEVYKNYAGGGMACICKSTGGSPLASQSVDIIMYYTDAIDQT